METLSKLDFTKLNRIYSYVLQISEIYDMIDISIMTDHKTDKIRNYIDHIIYTCETTRDLCKYLLTNCPTNCQVQYSKYIKYTNEIKEYEFSKYDVYNDIDDYKNWEKYIPIFNTFVNGLYDVYIDGIHCFICEIINANVNIIESDATKDILPTYRKIKINDLMNCINSFDGDIYALDILKSLKYHKSNKEINIIFGKLFKDGDLITDNLEDNIKLKLDTLYEYMIVYSKTEEGKKDIYYNVIKDLLN